MTVGVSDDLREAGVLPAATRVVEWGTAGAALGGEAESGDLHVVAPFPDGVLVALVDGLGHGPEAALAARAAAELLTLHAGESPLALIQRCHVGLKKTRGAVMSVASIDATDSSLTWAGVGNVEGVLLRCDEALGSESSRRVGAYWADQLPPLRAEVLPVHRGDTLILVTDGLRSDFRLGLVVEQDPQVIADAIFARCGKAYDDACVVVARYVALPRADEVLIRDDSDVVMARMKVRRAADEQASTKPPSRSGDGRHRGRAQHRGPRRDRRRSASLPSSKAAGQGWSSRLSTKGLASPTSFAPARTATPPGAVSAWGCRARSAWSTA